MVSTPGHFQNNYQKECYTERYYYFIISSGLFVTHTKSYSDLSKHVHCCGMIAHSVLCLSACKCTTKMHNQHTSTYPQSMCNFHEQIPFVFVSLGLYDDMLWNGTQEIQYGIPSILTLKGLNFWKFPLKWSGWISDSHCSLKALWSGMGN